MAKQKKLAYTKPLYTIQGTPVGVLKRFPSGNLSIEFLDGSERTFTVDAYGRSIHHATRGEQRIINEPPLTIEYLSLYPTGQVYTKNCCPVRSSSYGVDNLIQIKVTRRGDKIVAKEFV